MEENLALQTQPYKGARDFYPEDKRLQKYIFGKIRESVEKFGYEEYDAPILEPIEIFAAKTGDEIVNEQTYSFEDRGGRKVVIRPEMTPSVSRMVAAKRQELAYPLRWYSIVDNWRYERPQKGRMRQFHQLNVDIFGVNSSEADLEIIQVANEVLKSFGATKSMYEIQINSRKLMDNIFDELDIDAGIRKILIHLIDKKEKVEASEWEQLFYDKLEKDKADLLLGHLKKEEVPEEVQKLLDRLNDLGIENVRFNRYLSRGFEYYSDIVFEVFDMNPENNRAMFGGGRYDGLVELFGVEALPAVGFAMGDVTLEEFLRSNDLLPKLRNETDVIVVLVGDVFGQAQKIISELREMGLNVAVDFSNRKIDKQIKAAAKQGVVYTLFVGKNELETEQFTLKNLQTGKEEKHSLQRIVSIIKDYRKN